MAKALLKWALTCDTLFWRGPKRSRRIALSFDDGPLPSYTPEILRVLGREGIRGTFFLIGRHVVKYPELARAIVREGHEVGIHTFSHSRLRGKDFPSIAAEIEKTQQAFEGILGHRGSRFLRPPHGSFGPTALWYARCHGLSLALWSCDMADLRLLRDAASGADLNGRWPKAGEVMLFHDDLAEDVADLPWVIQQSQRRGFECGTLGEVLDG
jgi:peptidoglycan/xylan/chitin deacetylase (PgdA/CDA1 family)